MCRELRRAHSVRLKIIYVFKQGVITDMAGKVLGLVLYRIIALLTAHMTEKRR